MNNFNHKKIGIWGFGIVGQSALYYFDQFDCICIEILNTTKIESLPTTKNKVYTLIQDTATIQNFLEHNDFILHSPGIKLHNHQKFAHKFINELDILHDNNTTTSIIAITGTVGKTSITHLLENIIKQSYPNTIAAGNIGNPMLSLIKSPPAVAIIELSSFQLQPIRSFAPDLAIITNFFPNHLDHHTSIEEYFDAKCNILKYLTDKQQALIPLELADQITQHISTQSNWAFFTPHKPTAQEIKKYNSNQIYYLENKFVYVTHRGATDKLFDCNTLPPLTFDTNWLVIIAACNLYKINLSTISTTVEQLQLPDHRLQKVGSKNESIFYNDSKSTVWQATLQAVLAMDHNKPIKLFLGGLSKGSDRAPLLQALAGKNIEIYAFGKESQEIAQLCKKFNIAHHAHETLDTSWQACINSISQPSTILFSPGGSSFDLFADYKARGKNFTQLAHNYCNNN